VVSIDNEQDDQFKSEKDKNRSILKLLLPEVCHRLHSVRSAAEVQGVFPFKETKPSASYTGPLTIADSMTIEVKARHCFPPA
jgi:hypothetical protein